MARAPLNDRRLPFKLSSQTVGAQKAYAGMISRYGVAEGRRIFLTKAAEQGTGSTPRQQVNSTYKVGAKKGADGKFS